MCAKRCLHGRVWDPGSFGHIASRAVIAPLRRLNVVPSTYISIQELKGKHCYLYKTNLDLLCFRTEAEHASQHREHGDINTQMKSGYIYPICEDMVVDGKTGQVSIYTDGICKTWLHRCCAGLSKDALGMISTSDSPF